MKSAIFVVSIGDRPWFDLSLKWTVRYAKRCGYDVIYQTSRFGFSGIKLFCSEKAALQFEKLNAGRFFDCYDRLIILDDTCFVSPACPPMTLLVPESEIGCVLERHYTDKKFLQDYLSAHCQFFGLTESLPQERFFNSGVLVLSKQHRDVFAYNPGELMAAAVDEQYGDQGLLSKRAWELNYKLLDLGTKFNFVGSMIDRAGGVRNAGDSVNIFHLTSFLSRDRRILEAQELDLIFDQC